MLAPVALVAASTSAAATFWVMRVVLPAWNTPHTILEGVVHAPSDTPRQPALARRVTFVVVDGLSFEHARAIEELAPLRDEGAFRQLVAHYPTYTGPNITAMMTGLSPRESGVRLNGVETGVPGIDDVAHAAWDAGVFVRVRSRTYAEFDALARAPRQADVKRGRLQVVFDWEVDRARPTPTARPGTATLLELIYFGDVDEAGHREGARSERYAKAARDAGHYVQRVMRELDPAEDLLFVASDHAHRTAGGHGGAEPDVDDAFFAAWGRGVRRGVELPARPMRDVASTITVALGARTPSSNLGAPMLDVFDLDEARAAELAAEPFDQASRFGCTVHPTASCADVEAARAALHRGAGAADAIALLGTLAVQRDAGASDREADDALKRAAAGTSVGALFLALSQAGGFARPRSRSGYLAPLLLAVTYAATLFALGYRPTLSTMRQTEDFMIDAGKAAGVALAIMLFAAWRLRWGVRDALFTSLAAFAAMIPFWSMVGASPSALGPPVASALVFMVSPMVLAAGLAAIGIALIATARPPRASAGHGR